MGEPLLAMAGPSPLWYLTRGTGLVALLLLTATVGLGIVNQGRWTSPRWPRFVIGALHRDVSLLVVIVLIVHILTAELDTFAPVGWLAVVVPFASAYRAAWLGLGTLAFDLLLAVSVTSALRRRLGHRTWRAVHWLSYASWPIAVVHGLGTGSDARLGWVQVLTLVCGLTVLTAVVIRLVRDGRIAPRRRVAVGSIALAVAGAIVVWAAAGPLRPGWARRAGTPSNLLAVNSTTRPGSRATADDTTPPASPVRP